MNFINFDLNIVRKSLVPALLPQPKHKHFLLLYNQSMKTKADDLLSRLEQLEARNYRVEADKFL
jgi:hypothetical protein